MYGSGALVDRDGVEERGRHHKVPMRHEFGNKNIQFKGTLGGNANELLRSRSQQQVSRGSSTHSTNQVRQLSQGNIQALANQALANYPNTKSLLSAYNEKTVSDTVAPGRHYQRIQDISRHGSRDSSVHSLKKNYTTRSESLSNVRDSADSLINHSEDRLKIGNPKKAASISGPVGRRMHETNRSSLNHSFNASSNSSTYSRGSIDENDQEIVTGAVQLSFDPAAAVPGLADNLFPKDQLIAGTSPKSKPIELSDEPPAMNIGDRATNTSSDAEPNIAHPDRAMRILERQMQIREHALSADKAHPEESDLAKKWNSSISIDDKRMFETITNDLRRIAMYGQKPMLASLKRCFTDNSLARVPSKNGTHLDHTNGKFDLAKGRAELSLFCKELKQNSNKK